MSTKSTLILPSMAAPKSQSKDVQPHPPMHPMPLPSRVHAGLPSDINGRQSRPSAPGLLNQQGSVNEAVVEPIKKKKPNFSSRKVAKIRVSLPKISSYETELEYQADAPGRVLVRLERLMGTDRVRITDPRYMQTLLRRLEEDELKDWFKRTKHRKRAELNRYRQLAIEGHMEPGPDMQDLYQHPVFRVNRILNRLAKLDDVLASTTLKPPKITITEPFEEFAKTGFLFGFHKDHYLRSKTEYQHSGKDDSVPDDTNLATSGNELHMSKSERKRAAASRHKIIHDKIREQARKKEWGGEDYAVEEIPEEDGESENEDEYDENELELDEDGVLQDGSIFQAKAYYGIKAEDDLETAWTTERSPLIEMLYQDDLEETNMMYQFAKEIMATYRREQLKTDDFCQKAVAEVNNHVAQFRDLLIHIGQSRDGPEMREKIRRMRRICIESCRHAVHLLLQQVRNDASEGIPVDYSPQLVLLFFCTQLLLRELRKCRRLVMTLPIDMTSYYAEQRPGPSNIGGVLSQILLCRQLNPDFNAEEVCSIDKDTTDIADLLDEMQEFMPRENNQTLALAGEDVFTKWARRRRKKSIYRNFGSLCCVSKSARLTTV